MKDTLVIGMEHKKFAFDRNIEPVAAIHSGDRVIFETEDANVSLITKESDIWAEFPKLYDKGGGCNPVTGPVYVEGAKPGDCLSVDILRVVPGFIRKEDIPPSIPDRECFRIAKGLCSPFRTAHQDLPY